MSFEGNRGQDTRISVSLVLGHLAADSTADEIVAEFPDRTADRIAACLDHARDLADFEVAVCRTTADMFTPLHMLTAKACHPPLPEPPLMRNPT